MSDILDMEYINSLPQPFLAQEWGRSGDDWLWPVHDICVETGLVRIDVCGKPQVMGIGDFKRFIDLCGVTHRVDDFYLDGDRAIAAMSKKSRNKREGRYIDRIRK